jgi:hypothetical protein
MSFLTPFGEQSITLVAASFDGRQGAENAVSALEEDAHLSGASQVIAPGDPSFVTKLEPEQRGIWRTLVRSHLLLGILGALLGAATAIVLILAPWPAAASSPGFTFMFATVVGVIFGLMLAGLLTLRPDHGVVIDRVGEWLNWGRWVVIVRPVSEAYASAAWRMLKDLGAKPVRSF